MNEHDTHRRLLQLVHEYVKVNLYLERKPSVLKTIEVRKLLSEIRRVANDRRDEVMAIQREKREYLKKLKGKSNSPEAEDQDD